MATRKPTQPVNKPGPLFTKKHGDGQPFGLLWLDSLFQEIFLPNGAWQKVLLKVNDNLAERIRKQFDHAERKQMIFELMGAEYVQAYFPQEQYDPNIIEVPNISHQEKKKLQVDAQNWLQKEMAKVTAEVGCERPMPGQKQSPPSTEMQEFLRFVRYLSSRNMSRHLHLQEKEVLKAWENYQWEQTEAKHQEKEVRDKLRLKREYERLTGTTPNPTRGILRGGMTPFSNKPPPTAASTTSQMSNRTTANIKGAMYGASDDPPTFWGMQSNSIGRSIVSLLKRDPRRYGEVASRLHGRQLPSTLRMYLWLDMLLRQERERLKDSNVEKLVRERFGKALSRGITDLKVKRATHSPISGLIDNAVIEIYDSTPGMRMFLDYDQHMKEAAKALNILYVYDRTYEPYLIHWLFPIQMAFQDFSGQSEHVYDLAMYLDLLNTGCFPKWPSVFAVAERVMTRLETVDKELHDHLESISLIQVNINPKEFLVQLIHEEKTKAHELLAATSTKSDVMSKDLLANPRIFLRKWVGEGFASVLDTQAVLYVWDQCFLQRWDPHVLEDFCLVLLLLLRHKFMEAEDYKGMRRVFQREPCKLYTMDIQRAWVHIQRDGQHEEVHPMNRQAYKVARPELAVDPIEPVYSPIYGPSPQPSILTTKPVPMVGLKHFRLEIDIPAESLYTADLDPGTISLECQLYFGSVYISTQKSTVIPTSRGMTTDRYGSKFLRVIYPKQKFVFDSFDSGQFDLEQEMGGYPFAIVQATAGVTSGGQLQRVPLGWARIKLFQHKSDVEGWADPHNLSQWILLTGDFKQRLTSGEAPEYGTGGAPQYKDSIGQNSWLNTLVFDPNNEPPTPARSVTPEPMPRTLTPPPPKQKTPTPEPKTPTPVPTPPPELPGIKDKFVLYIDGVDHIPDNATITKVTGRVVKSGALTGLQDVLALPELTSRARSPRCMYKYVINDALVQTDIGMILLLRVYTVDRLSGELKVIGSCLCPVFNQQTGKVHVGGHQRVLHYGMPDLKKGLSVLTEAALDSHTRVPGCTIYYRLAKFTENHEAAPSINLDNYPLEDRAFNESEKRVIDSYQADTKHPKTTSNMITLLQRLEKVNPAGLDPLVWLEDRLNQKTRLPANEAAGYLDLTHMVHYRLDKGIYINIKQAHGLPEGLYVQCFARVYAGDQAQGQALTSDGHGRDDEQMVTLKTDMDSHQMSPRWLDPPKKINPHWDNNTFLLVQLFGIDIKYTANANHKTTGTITNIKGEALKLGPDNLIGWSLVPLFNEIYTHTGEHHVPVFKGQPDQAMLKECSKRSIPEVINDNPTYRANSMDASSLVVNIWDGHFVESELLEPLQRQQTVLEAVGKVDSCTNAEQNPQGNRLSQFILDGLSKKEQKQSTAGSAYVKEKPLFTDSIEKIFYNLMEDALMEAGYGPL